MTSQYPKDQQNPPSEPGQRPEDQSAPRQRVPPRTKLNDAAHDPRGIDDAAASGEHLPGFQERIVEERHKKH